MPKKPNYNFQRAERDRAKKAAKEAKLQHRRTPTAPFEHAVIIAPESVKDDRGATEVGRQAE